MYFLLFLSRSSNVLIFRLDNNGLPRPTTPFFIFGENANFLPILFSIQFFSSIADILANLSQVKPTIRSLFLRAVSDTTYISSFPPFIILSICIYIKYMYTNWHIIASNNFHCTLLDKVLQLFFGLSMF